LDKLNNHNAGAGSPRFDQPDLPAIGGQPARMNDMGLPSINSRSNANKSGRHNRAMNKGLGGLDSLNDMSVGDQPATSKDQLTYGALNHPTMTATPK
jgi:hypothetical protein